MKLRSVLTVLFIAGIVQTASAEIKEETITADQIGKAKNPSGKTTEYKLEVKDATPQQIIDAFSKLTGVTLRLENLNERKPETIYDININEESLPEALDQLARQMRMGIYNGGDALRISPGFQEGFQDINNNRMNRAGRSSRATISSISVNESLRENGMKSKTLTVNVNYTSDAKGIFGSPRLKVLEAIDDQGRPINFGQNQNESNRMRFRPYDSVGVGVSIPNPDPTMTKIAKLKLELSIDVPRTFKRTIITELADKSVSCKIAGASIEIGPVAMEDNQWVVKMSQPQNTSIRLFDDMRSVRVFADEGGAMYLSNNGWGGDGKFMRASPRVSLYESYNGGNNGANLPKPTSLIWDTVDEVDTKTIIVEASDIVIP